jgi:hypothetical protein
MTWVDIHNWMEKFHSEVVDSNKTIRGFTFIGCHLETWDSSEVVIVLEPGLRGTTPESRANDFGRMTMVEDGRSVLEAFIPYDRFQKIVSGKDQIQEEDWVWSDE